MDWTKATINAKISPSHRFNTNNVNRQKKAEIEKRKYELLELQLSLANAYDESSQSSSKFDIGQGM
jgi:hypothetical protein